MLAGSGAAGQFHGGDLQIRPTNCRCDGLVVSGEQVVDCVIIVELPHDGATAARYRCGYTELGIVVASRRNVWVAVAENVTVRACVGNRPTARFRITQNKHIVAGARILDPDRDLSGNTTSEG